MSLPLSIGDTACPVCGQKTLLIIWKYSALPLGAWSIAGGQLKFSAAEVPWLVCDSCGVESEGHL